jgi:hypothetical protein
MEKRDEWKRYRVYGVVECDGLHEGLARVTATREFMSGYFTITKVEEIDDDSSQESTD